MFSDTIIEESRNYYFKDRTFSFGDVTYVEVDEDGFHIVHHKYGVSIVRPDWEVMTVVPGEDE